MSVGQTSNLELIYVNPDDPVPNWPKINGLNMDKLDSLFNSELQFYTPSMEATSGDLPALGDGGALDGAYLRFLDIYFFWIWMQFGTDSDPGTGNDYRWTLPVSAHPSYTFSSNGSCVGGGYVNPGGGLDRQFAVPILTSIGSPNNFALRLLPGNDAVGGDTPAAFGDGDQIEIFGRFKAASI